MEQARPMRRRRYALFGQKRQPLNVPGEMMHCVSGGQNHAASRGESQPHETMPRNFQTGGSLRGDLNNAALARERGGDVQVAVCVESQALRASQTAEKFVNRSLRIDSVHAVKARRGWPGNEQISL